MPNRPSLRKQFLTTFLAALLGVLVVAFAYELYRQHERENEKQREREEAEESKQHYVNAAHLATGLSALAQLRPHIEIFWHETGELPCRATDLHLPTELLALQTAALRDIALTDCGELTATYTEASGLDGGTLVLRANEVEAASDRGLAWECLTADYPEIEEHLPSCHYEPPSDALEPSAEKAT